MHTVAVPVYDRVPTFELAVPCEVFGIDRSDMAVPNYRLLLCRAEEGQLHAGAGFRFDVPHTLEDLELADTIVVPAWRDIRERPPHALLNALRDAYARGARIASLCSGAFILAAAGLLDGRRATTHWMYAKALAERFPQVRVDPTVLYIDDGQILTSAGTAAGIDLCLHLVRLDYGAEVANIFARRMVVSPHRDGGQAQYVPAAVPEEDGNSTCDRVMTWALSNLDQPLSVRQLAQRAGMPVRTFARHFRDSTGATPGRWLTGQRVRTVQRALETRDTPIERLAEECGFGSAAALRLHFKRYVGVAPLTYRNRFRQIEKAESIPRLETRTKN